MISDLKEIVKISKENYEILINGGTVKGYKYNPNTLYLVEDTGEVVLEYITDEEIEELWNSSDNILFIKGNVLYGVKSVKNGIATLNDIKIKNGILYI